MRYSKRILVSGLSGVVIALSSAAPEKVHAQTSDFNEAENMMSFNQVELKDQLIYGLRTFLPEQQAFIDKVLAKVDSGEISRAMVNVVFVWSKKRNPKIPFPYFEAVMRLLAEKRGVTFDSTK
ncbi:MAG: hypothetical protein ACOVLE_04725 [Pirellula staleyi]